MVLFAILLSSIFAVATFAYSLSPSDKLEATDESWSLYDGDSTNKYDSAKSFESELYFDIMGEMNSKVHFTAKYKIKNYDEAIVLRRGFDFKFNVLWGRPCDNNDDISLYFKLMTFKNNNKVTVNIIANEMMNGEKDINEWSARYYCVGKNNGKVVIQIPVTASIGAYGLIFSLKNSERQKNYIVHQNIGIIFNPYLKQDTVYENEDDLSEYVENEHGYIWCGSSAKHTTKPWLYGQFEPISLNATFYGMNKCNLTGEERANPVEVARAISAISNAEDDWGVLVGRWDGDYEDIYQQKATPPERWLGSVAILEYYRESQISVPYGQCWVFAGVVTTMLRSLGIPSRPVTCFTCGHDTDNNLIIDFYLEENGKKSSTTTDSIWNYHVWVQAFMRRPDLSMNGIFDGWQDVDGTPQEISGNKFQMGPTPVNAVKLGIVDAEYDLRFVYSEVNADVVWWKGGRIYDIETSRIGTAVLTKAIGSKAALDITSTYKAKEKSKEERDTLRRICDRLGINHPSFNDSIKQRSGAMKQEYNVEIKCPDTINLGDSISIAVTMKCISWSDYKSKQLNVKTLNYTLTAETMHYNGKTAKYVRSDERSIVIKSANGVKIEMDLNAKDYENSNDYDYIQLIFTATDVHSGAFVLKYKEIHINIPPLKITYIGRTADGRSVTLLVTYTNPLNSKADNCALVTETELGQRQQILFKRLRSKQKIEEQVTIATPEDKEKDFVLISFSCDEVVASKLEVRISDHTFQKYSS